MTVQQSALLLEAKESLGVVICSLYCCKALISPLKTLLVVETGRKFTLFTSVMHGGGEQSDSALQTFRAYDRISGSVYRYRCVVLVAV